MFAVIAAVDAAAAELTTGDLGTSGGFPAALLFTPTVDGTATADAAVVNVAVTGAAAVAAAGGRVELLRAFKGLSPSVLLRSVSPTIVQE